MERYVEQISSLSDVTFQQVRNIAVREAMQLPQSDRDNLYNQLKRGVALLDRHEVMCQYLFSLGNMHEGKLHDALSNMPPELWSHPFEIIDWGCGQAIGTMCLMDFLKNRGQEANLRKITLIEPSKAALERAVLHTNVYFENEAPVTAINSLFEGVTPDQIRSESGFPVLHIFSNILDVADIDLKYLSQMVDEGVVSDNYLLCVGPLNPNNQRIDAFLRYFDTDLVADLYRFESSHFGPRNSWTYKARVYKLEPNREGHLIPIEYFPSVQFQAAYELDAVRSARRNQPAEYDALLSHFEVAAPFDLGASVYEDVHPILAVLNNIIVRGLPTRASVFIEEQFSKAFRCSERFVKLGEIEYASTKPLDFENLHHRYSELLDADLQLDYDIAIEMQMLLTPLAVARFQKILVEAIITGHLPMTKEKWMVVVEEADVPFAHLALADFRELFENLTQLSEEYKDFQLPEVELQVIGNEVFRNSGLHLGQIVHEELPSALRHIQFDLVVSQATLRSVNESIESFSKFRCANNCYFNIRAIAEVRSERLIYTSSLIKYDNLVSKNAQGVFTEIQKSKAHLTYFLQLILRKESFRAGQLPILDRALQNLAVIGLLPTGGGKSLTYQLAAMLQPGVTMIIDPLKSLMKDQYDGLLSQGIDSCTYINSSLSSTEKKRREKQLESSQLQFIFLSPERLAIAKFRERLRHMHDYNVYFSYGVIDEVHCVSEWGHDFRFHYLHLGRNLYNFVKAKEGEISLFGLTATASFDVLADVERELSGHGAFNLDQDVIVRYENTNRLELQYKIERVPVKFDPDPNYDRRGHLAHLPKALNINSHWPQLDSKREYLLELIPKIPGYINELQTESNVSRIKSKFAFRQGDEEGTDVDLDIEMPANFYEKNGTYPHAGIIFSPHAKTTRISVDVVASEIRDNLTPVLGTFKGGDDKGGIHEQNLENFRSNKLPLMVATKAFGMGIDKPNVRFTINLNYSSSLESFVQEAGRAGRDQKMALATILVSDYNLVKIDFAYTENTFPLGIIRGRWFHERDLEQILNEYHLQVPDEFLLRANPENDIVKLSCTTDARMFGFNNCSNACSAFDQCQLKLASPDSRGWMAREELNRQLADEGLNISKNDFRYLNADYHTLMHFFNDSFKGERIEREFMNELLNKMKVTVAEDEFADGEEETGFLTRLYTAEVGQRIVVHIPYTEENHPDLSKALYRMSSIELLEDFTQDYKNKQFRIIAVRKGIGGYLQGLRTFLLRYYTPDRAEKEIQKVRQIGTREEELPEVIKEIYRCLRYLTEFVYDKISEKRKRAMDDMRLFCMDGLSDSKHWTEINEDLKDFIYYYFNSKYAKTDYVTDNGLPYSLLNDTDSGKRSNEVIVRKYMRVVDDEIVGVGTPLDNVKHLYGAVRLISRSLTDSNPALALLEAFCLAHLGFRENVNLRNQFYERYLKGMIEFKERLRQFSHFRDFVEDYNNKISPYIGAEMLHELNEELMLRLLGNQMNLLTAEYLMDYERI